MANRTVAAIDADPFRQEAQRDKHVKSSGAGELPGPGVICAAV
jgi:hypothetical protein